MSSLQINLWMNNEEVKTHAYTEVRDPGRLDEVVGLVAQGNASDVEKAVRFAHEAFLSWRNTSLEERCELLRKAADVLEQESSILAPLMTRESGMLLSAYRGEIPAAAGILRQTIRIAEDFFQTEQLEDDHHRIRIEKMPLGVIAALTPWNVPMAITMSKIAPILVTGNTVVLKPSPTASIAVSIALQKIAVLFPPGVINIVHGNAEVGAALTTNPLVRKITLTGGGVTASHVMKSAADSLKRVHFELGGNDPAILLDDVCLEDAIPKIVENAFVRSGQVCVATKRVYIPEKRFAEACELFVEQTDRFKIGYGLDERATFAPVNNVHQYNYIKGLIERVKQSEARVLELGTKLEPEHWDNGYYIQPTVVIGPDPGHEIVINEQFGPVVPLVSYRTEEEVIHLANQTEYGLGSTVWTSDEERGWRVARQLEAGLTGINGKIDSPLGFHIVPFGGVKKSGMGYERGKAGLEEFIQYHGITLHKKSR